MKTTEETKNLLAVWGTGVLIECGDGTYRPPGIWQGTAAEVCRDALALIKQLESTISKASEALCGKENATLEEFLQEVSQVKSRLAQVERERDAAVEDICLMDSSDICNMCARFDEGYIPMPPHCKYANDGECFRWRGVCEENTKKE